MTALNGNARTAETYLAGFGASGALIAGAAVAFMLLVGLVAFDAWPRAAGLLADDTGTVESVDANTPADAAAAVLGPAADLVAAARPGDSLVSQPGAGGGTRRPGVGGNQGETNSPGGSQPGGTGTGNGTGTGTQGSGSTNVGNTVNDTVDNLGKTVDDTVAGLGDTVNDTVNGLNTTVNNTVNGVNELLNGLSGK